MLGDKIVADRLYRLGQCNDREAAEIMKLPAPRTAAVGTWPPSKAEFKRLREQAKAAR